MNAPHVLPELTHIGKYRIERKLGEGTTGEVFLCRDDFAGRDVAVKLIHLHRMAGASERVLRKFLLNEAALVGKLGHPHVVRLYDAAVEEDFGYVVMEYVPGGTLEAYCAPDRLLAPAQVAHIAFKCTRALEHARSHGITHRDIKPANILVAGESSRRRGLDIKISDFGSALDVAADSTLVSGVGSPAYMSPEQIRDEPLSHQTDIYSLGVVMYQLLTGRLPYQATNNYGLMYQIAHGEPTPLETVRPDLPEALVRIVKRAMAKDLAARYRSWIEFSFDLASLFETAILDSGVGVGDSEKFSALRALPFFADFPDGELWEVVRFSQWLDLAADVRLMRDGEPGDFFCIVAAGEMRITKRGRLLDTLRPGACIGEMAYLQGASGAAGHTHTRAADVTTVGPARLVVVHSKELAHASESCRQCFERAFLHLLVDRLTLANDRLAAA